MSRIVVRREDAKKMGIGRLLFFIFPAGLNLFLMGLGLSGLKFFLFSLLIVPFYAGGAAYVLNVLPRPRKVDIILTRYSLHLAGTLGISIVAVGWAAAVFISAYIFGLWEKESIGLVPLIGTTAGWFLLWLALWPWYILPWIANWPSNGSRRYPEWVWWEINHLNPGVKQSITAAFSRKNIFVKGIPAVICCLGLAAILVHAADLTTQNEYGLLLLYFFAALPILHLIMTGLTCSAFAEVHPELLEKKEIETPDTGAIPGYEIPFTPERKKTRPIQIAYRNQKGVIYNPGNTVKPIELYSGPRGDVGIVLSPEEALSYRWAEHFTEAGADWFLEFIREMALGRDIDTAELEKIARRRNNSLG